MLKISLVLTSFYLLTLFGLLFVITLFGLRRIPEYSQFTVDRKQPIYTDHPLTWKFAAKNDGLSTLLIFLDNPGRVNIDSFNFSLLNAQGQPVREIPANGRNIGVNDTVRFQFPPIADSANSEYSIQLSAPDTKNPAQAITAGVASTGELSYQVFYRPLSKRVMFQDTLNSFLLRLNIRFIVTFSLSLLASIWFIKHPRLAS